MQQRWLESLIPEEKRAAAEKALQKAFNTYQLEEIAPLPGGTSGAFSYKITVMGKHYVLRIVTQRNPLQDPARYFICMNIAAKAGVAPQVIYTDAESGISITDFIQKADTTIDDLPSEILLSQITKTVKAIHSLPAFPPLVDFLTGVEGMIANNKPLQLLPDNLLKEHSIYFSQIQEIYPRNSNVVPSHNDLNPNNLLFDGEKLWIIDWEAAFQADEYVDLATVAIFFPIIAKQEETFLEGYFASSFNIYKKARFFLMKQIVSTYYINVLLQMTNATKEQGLDIPNVSTSNYEEFRELIRSERYLLSSPTGQMLRSQALLWRSLQEMKSEFFSEAIKKLQKHHFSI